MKLNLEKTMLYGIVLSILINCGFFHIFDGYVLKITQFILIAFLNIVSFKAYIHYRQVRLALNQQLWYLLFVIVFIVGLQFVYQVFFKDENWLYTLSTMAYLYYMGMLFPVTTYLIVAKKWDRLIRWIFIIGIIVFTVALLFIIFQDFIGIDLPFFDYYKNIQTSRDGYTRIGDLTPFQGIILSYLISYIIFYGKRSIISKFIYIAIVIITMILVQQTRMLVVDFVFMIFIEFVKKSSSKSLSRAISYFFIVLCGIFIVYSGVADSVYASFTIDNTNEKASSTLMRIEEYYYAFNAFLENPLFGYGTNNQVIEDAIQISIWNVMFKEAYSHVDVGIIGSFGMYGIAYLGFFIIPMMHFYNILSINYIKHSDIVCKISKKEQSFLRCCFVYLLLSSILTVVTDASRIYAWPYYLALFYFYRYRTCM